MVIDKVKKVNEEEKNKSRNEKAADMMIGKWVKCDSCKEIIYKEDLHKNYSICPYCGKYFRLSSRRRIRQIADEGTFKEIGEEYPDVMTRSYLVDAASMFMVKDPGRFEIVVTSNLFGDILTDLGAAIAGGMGLAAGANLNPEKKYPSMFEPIHGSAPDIAGKGIANPLAAIWSASQMLDFFGYKEWGKRFIDSIEEVLVEKNVLTPDLGGSASTSEVGDAVARKIRK